MSVSVELLFDEFAASYARGEHPDAREYLELAGDRRDELARLLDGFLAAAPTKPPGEETLTLFESLLLEDAGTPPLLAERVRRGWRRDEIVEWIRERFGIAEDKREKIARYWHELETGLLPASRISEPLREAVSERFGEALEAAVIWKAPVLDSKVAYQRVADFSTAPAITRPERVSGVDALAISDDVDRLFVPSRLP